MRRSAHALLLALVPACYDSGSYDALLEYGPPTADDSESDGADSGDSSPPISTVTTEPPPHGSDSDSDASSAGDTGDDDTEGALPAPQIVEHEFTPGPIIFKNGPLTVTVTAEGAEGVSMQLEDGSVIELEHDQDPVVFQGELAVNTGLANGTQTLKLTPWRGDLVGDEVTTSYTIALPTPGEELFWETNELSSSGIVKALGVLPGGDLVEFGQDTLDGASRCYLRRRNQGGWSSFRSVLPGLTCSPVDMKIDADGAITLLAYRTGVGGTEWWLGQLNSWHSGVGDLPSLSYGPVVAADEGDHQQRVVTEEASVAASAQLGDAGEGLGEVRLLVGQVTPPARDLARLVAGAPASGEDVAGADRAIAIGDEVK